MIVSVEGELLTSSAVENHEAEDIGSAALGGAGRAESGLALDEALLHGSGEGSGGQGEDGE